MNNRESDQWFPPGVCCIGRPAAQAAFRFGNNWEYQLSLQEDYTPGEENRLFHHRYPLIFTVFISSFLFFIFLQSVLHACLYLRECLMWDHHVWCLCLVRSFWISEESQSKAQDGGDTCGFFVGLIYSAKSDFALCCIIYYHKGPLAFKVLPLNQAPWDRLLFRVLSCTWPFPTQMNWKMNRQPVS